HLMMFLRRTTVRRLSAILAAALLGFLVLARAQAQSPAEPEASATPAATSTPAATPAPTGTPAPAATAPQAAGPRPMRQSPLAMRNFNLRYRPMDDAYRIISPYVGPHGTVKMQPAQKTLTIQDAPENLQRIAALISSYDVPPRNVEVLVQL